MVVRLRTLRVLDDYSSVWRTVEMLYFWAALASLAAVLVETIFRKYSYFGWVKLFPIILIPMLVINYSVFRLMRDVDDFIGGFVLFSLVNLGLRALIGEFLLNESATPGTWVAIALTLLAKLAVKFLK